MRLFGNTGQATESSLDAIVLSMMGTVLNRTFANTFKSSDFQAAVEQAIRKHMARPHVLESVVTQTVDASAFIVSVIMFAQNKV